MLVDADGETNEQLRNRKAKVESEIATAKKRKPSDQRNRWIGSLTFTLLQIESKMRERNMIE